MKNQAEFIRYLESRKADVSQIALSLEVVDGFERYLGQTHLPFPPEDPMELTRFSELAIAGKTDAFDRLVALARYCRFQGYTAGLTHVLTLLGTSGVLESIEERAKALLGDEVSELRLETLEKPPLGSGYDRFPEAIRQLLERFEAKLSTQTCHRILAGNHHKLPLSHFEEDKRVYAEQGIDGYLKWRHQSMLHSMEESVRNQTVWYEQVITPEVLEFVSRNQEIQSGVRDGNTVYVTKIPYHPGAYLTETDPLKKRHLACHCPFVRNAILDPDKPVSDTWCYCTGGYEKLPFDVIFGRDLDVEVLETVLGGSLRCRFAITLPESAVPGASPV